MGASKILKKFFPWISSNRKKKSIIDIIATEQSAKGISLDIKFSRKNVEEYVKAQVAMNTLVKNFIYKIAFNDSDEHGKNIYVSILESKHENVSKWIAHRIHDAMNSEEGGSWLSSLQDKYLNEYMAFYTKDLNRMEDMIDAYTASIYLFSKFTGIVNSGLNFSKSQITQDTSASSEHGITQSASASVHALYGSANIKSEHARKNSLSHDTSVVADADEVQCILDVVGRVIDMITLPNIEQYTVATQDVVSDSWRTIFNPENLMNIINKIDSVKIHRNQ